MVKQTGFKIKDHITPKAKRITGLLKGKYGLGLDTFNKALKGDLGAIKLIGEAGRQGAKTSELAPMLAEAYINLIKGTEEYNKAVSQIVKQGATSAINIDKAASQALLANQKYGHQRSELAAEFVAAKTAEKVRHKYSMNYIKIKSYIDQYLTQIDNNAKTLEQANRPYMKQIEEDTRYETVVTKHLLQHGENAQVDLIPQKQYATVQENGKTLGFKERLKQFAGAFGF